MIDSGLVPVLFTHYNWSRSLPPNLVGAVLYTLDRELELGLRGRLLGLQNLCEDRRVELTERQRWPFAHNRNLSPWEPCEC